MTLAGANCNDAAAPSSRNAALPWVSARSVSDWSSAVWARPVASGGGIAEPPIETAKPAHSTAKQKANAAMTGAKGRARATALAAPLPTPDRPVVLLTRWASFSASTIAVGTDLEG